MKYATCPNCSLITTLKKLEKTTKNKMNGTTFNALLQKNKVRYRLKDNIRQNVDFEFINITQPELINISRQDVIFCQNLFIYFNESLRVKTLEVLLNRLRSGGYLFLAPGEVVGYTISGAVQANFKDTLSYRRNKEAVHVRVTR